MFTYVQIPIIYGLSVNEPFISLSGLKQGILLNFFRIYSTEVRFIFIISCRKYPDKMGSHYRCYLRLAAVLTCALSFCFGYSEPTKIECCSVSFDEHLDCSRQKLAIIPSPNMSSYITSWDLSHNEIVTVKNGTFTNMLFTTVINLSFNKISQMEPDCFSGLHNLKVLDISHNQLAMPLSFSPGIFKPLQALEILYMQGTVNSNSYPEEALKDLINLKELYIQGINQKFGPAFTHLTSLEVLHLSPPNCKTGVIRNDTLLNLRFSKIRELVFQQCSITKIEERALSYFPNLDTLNLACNYNFGIKNALQAVSNIPGKPVETLVLDDIDRTAGQYRFFNKTTVCIADFPNLKRASVRNNGIDFVSLNVLSCVPSLEVVNFGFNALSLTWAPWHIFRPGTRDYWKKSNVTELDLSYAFISLQYTFKPLYCPEHMVPTSKYFRNAKILNNAELQETPTTQRIPSILDKFLGIHFSPKLQAVHMDHIHFALTKDQTNLAAASGLLSSSLCQINLPRNDLRFVNASYNAFGDFNCRVTGLDHLQILDLSHSGLKTLVLHSSPNLRILFLTGNELGTNYTQWKTALNHVPVLEFVSISNNKIKQFPANTFSSTKIIKDIDLSKNSLSKFNIELQDLVELERLDLSNNVLPSLQEPFLRSLEDRISKNKTLTIDLLGNPFQCNCEAIEFLKFIKIAPQHNIAFKHFSEYYCSYLGEEIHLLEVDIDQLVDTCKETNLYTIIIAVLVTIIALLVILAIVIYTCRWRIAWKVYEVRRIVRQAKRKKSFKLPVHK